MKIVKPVVWGDSYWCYKSYPALLILAVVDADGIFISSMLVVLPL